MAVIPPRSLTGHVDYQVEQTLKDLIKATGNHAAALQELSRQIAALPVPPTLAEIQHALSATGSNPLNIAGLLTGTGTGPGVANPAATGSTAGPPPPPPPPPPGVCLTDLTKGQPGGVPAAPNLRWFRANSFGVHVPGLPSVIGSANDPSLCLSWFYNRYTNPVDRASILAAHQARGLTHFQLSWPDARVTGCDIPTYVALSQEVAAAGFYVGHFLCGKGNDSPDTGAIIAGVTPVIQALQAANVIPWACVGWELTLWLSSDQIQALIDAFASLLVPATNLYVHFQPGYMSDGRGTAVADFWNPQVGKLTGVLFQDPAGVANNCSGHQGRLNDVLQRLAGNDRMPTNSGFGHPFDGVDYEVTSQDQFDGNVSEAQGDAAGFNGICAPAQSGPAGVVGMMGYGNGCITPAGNRV
jgi:hypothetical protein